MIFQSLILASLCLCLDVLASGRSPAVEDFVGIEVEQSRVAPTGNEVLFNLEKDIKKIQAKKDQPQKVNPKMRNDHARDWNVTTLTGLTLLLILPLSVWFLIMSHLKKKASVESASNIEVLEKYRREREKKSEEKIRKVS